MSNSYYWQRRINQTQYLQTHNSFCIYLLYIFRCPRPGPCSHRSSFLTIRKLLSLGQWHIRCICCLSNIWALIRSTSYIWGSFGFYEIFGGFRWVSYMQGPDTRVGPWKTINYLWWVFVVFLNFTGRCHNGLIQKHEIFKFS